ncbi:hypothetical protein HZY91_00080 [Facklamia sp. DSM 111018]|uniref:NfeD-like C-terminal domain-containing protein n=1 Tax=Facklamia lactis TaxID=2749967 RepID=A0ABS0LMM0_9LACT|nr:NfeD family protein [Facklamia lactis]MBG9980036.1 hypothetical protein [Facklamia lactis]MBG9985284.1 hypothetical protein [Facklamia lactis]
MDIVILVGISLLVLALFTRHSWFVIPLALICFVMYFGVTQDRILLSLLFIIGVGLILIEFYIPDFGLAGIIGFGASVYALWLKLENLTHLALLLLACLMVIVAVASILIKSGFELSISPNFILDRTVGEKQKMFPEKSTLPEVGSIGKAMVDLKPVGRIQIKDTIYDAYSMDQMISAGAAVKIVKIEKNKIYVRREVIG